MLASGWTVIDRRRCDVLQLDIDNAPVEQALMNQIADDPSLQGMISEMFFEQHFNDAAVRDRFVILPHSCCHDACSTAHATSCVMRKHSAITPRVSPLPCARSNPLHTRTSASDLGICRAVLTLRWQQSNRQL